MMYTGLWIFGNVYESKSRIPQNEIEITIAGHNWPLVWSPAGGWAESVDLNVWLVPLKGHLCDPLPGDRASQEHPFFWATLRGVSAWGGCPREVWGEKT